VEITRRTALAGILATPALPAWAQEADDPFPALPKSLGSDSNPDFQSSTLGRKRPAQAFFKVAEALALEAPYNCAPIMVARYWRGIGQGAYPRLKDSSLQSLITPAFVRGWPTYYNPVIMNFFKVTGFDPKAEGDGTAWCAAFVNWCIARGTSKSNDLNALDASKANGSKSASSGSFRCWGSATVSPQVGDVIVWAKDGTVNGCAAGQGHVAFYDGPADGERMWVVGGNQRDPSTVAGATQSAVCRKKFGKRFLIARKTGSYYKTLHSFRTANLLRG
jgi:hypothetical protein